MQKFSVLVLNERPGLKLHSKQNNLFLYLLQIFNIANSSGDLKRESTPLKNLAISTLETMSAIDFKSKELKKASTEAYEIMKKNQADKTSCHVSLDKNDVANFKGFKSAVVRLEKIAVPNE